MRTIDAKCRPHIDDGLEVAGLRTITVFVAKGGTKVELGIEEIAAWLEPEEAAIVAMWLLMRAEECKR